MIATSAEVIWGARMGCGKWVTKARMGRSWCHTIDAAANVEASDVTTMSDGSGSRGNGLPGEVRRTSDHQSSSTIAARRNDDCHAFLPIEPRRAL